MTRAEIWVQFAVSAASTRFTPTAAAKVADDMMVEFEKRFEHTYDFDWIPRTGTQPAAK